MRPIFECHIILVRYTGQRKKMQNEHYQKLLKRYLLLNSSYN